MSMKETADKLEKYQERLKSGKAEKIRPDHVGKILAKLVAREAELSAEIAETTKHGRRARLEEKRATLRELIDKARWLASQV